MLPCSLYSYLCLYCVAKGTTKSILVRDHLEKLRKEQGIEQVLMREIAAKIDREWRRYQDIHPNASLKEFKKRVTEELKERNLTRGQILLILKEIICSE
jgi:hypothetical protein